MSLYSNDTFQYIDATNGLYVTEKSFERSCEFIAFHFHSKENNAYIMEKT